MTADDVDSFLKFFDNVGAQLASYLDLDSSQTGKKSQGRHSKAGSHNSRKQVANNANTSYKLTLSSARTSVGDHVATNNLKHHSQQHLAQSKHTPQHQHQRHQLRHGISNSNTAAAAARVRGRRRAKLDLLGTTQRQDQDSNSANTTINNHGQPMDSKMPNGSQQDQHIKLANSLIGDTSGPLNTSALDAHSLGLSLADELVPLDHPSSISPMDAAAIQFGAASHAVAYYPHALRTTHHLDSYAMQDEFSGQETIPSIAHETGVQQHQHGVQNLHQQHQQHSHSHQHQHSHSHPHSHQHQSDNVHLSGTIGASVNGQAHIRTQHIHHQQHQQQPQILHREQSHMSADGQQHPTSICALRQRDQLDSLQILGPGEHCYSLHANTVQLGPPQQAQHLDEHPHSNQQQQQQHHHQQQQQPTHQHQQTQHQQQQHQEVQYHHLDQQWLTSSLPSTENGLHQLGVAPTGLEHVVTLSPVSHQSLDTFNSQLYPSHHHHHHTVHQQHHLHEPHGIQAQHQVAHAYYTHPVEPLDTFHSLGEEYTPNGATLAPPAITSPGQSARSAQAVEHQQQQQQEQQHRQQQQADTQQQNQSQTNRVEYDSSLHSHQLHHSHSHLSMGSHTLTSQQNTHSYEGLANNQNNINSSHHHRHNMASHHLNQSHQTTDPHNSNNHQNHHHHHHHLLPLMGGLEPSGVIIQDINLASASWSSPEDLYSI